MEFFACGIERPRVIFDDLATRITGEAQMTELLPQPFSAPDHRGRAAVVRNPATIVHRVRDAALAGLRKSRKRL